MSDIGDLEQRIVAALDRIDRGVEGLTAAPPETGTEPTAGEGSDPAELAAALEAERTTNAQLEARVQALKDKADSLVAERESQLAMLEDELRELRAALDARGREAARLREVNAALRASNRKLREANAAGLADADLIDGAMRSELDALRATQAADRAELDDIIGTLAPLIEETDDV